MSEQEIQGKIVLITGAGSGLGEATARAFALAGATVAAIDINEAAIERVCADLTKQERQSYAFVCDVSRADAVSETVQAVGERFGRVDIIVNCAAVDYSYSVEGVSIE